MTILYVEDDEEDREIFKEALYSIGPYHTIITARDGRQAMQVLEEFVPDYIFLDINLPEMDGKQVLKTLKQSTGLSVIPVIMFTTSVNPEDRVECTSLGAADFISKPSMFHDLCRTLKRYL
jgi:CheY-like chemotaxis protein